MTSPGACFSKVPKLFGRISCDIILFVSSKRRRLEARNFAFIIISNVWCYPWFVSGGYEESLLSCVCKVHTIL